MVQFDPTTYSVTEGGSVNIMLTADSNFSVPFNVTLTSDSDEGRVRSLGCVPVYMHVLYALCTSIQMLVQLVQMPIQQYNV